MNKPKYDKRMTTTILAVLPEEDHKAIFAIAEKENKKVSEIIRGLIKSYINKKEEVSV